MGHGLTGGHIFCFLSVGGGFFLFLITVREQSISSPGGNVGLLPSKAR